MHESRGRFEHGDYTVGWICALPETELVAAGAMLDKEHPVLPAAEPQDTNSYLLGEIGDHNVVIACLPAETTGKVSAATVAKDMLRSFPAVRVGLMVGIGGGAPYYGAQGNTNVGHGGSEEDSEDDSEDIQDIRLGDVVISLHSKSTEAVLQYDFGKSEQSKGFIRIGGQLNKPPSIVLNAVSMLRGHHARKGHKIPEMLSQMLTENPLMATKFKHPGSEKDRLFKSDVIHNEGQKSCKSCCGLNNINLVKRRDRPNGIPYIHYGTIGSADQVMKDAILRDMWARREKISCFETEAAGKIFQTHSRRPLHLTFPLGLMDSFPCLVIRGICDYADSHKSNIWQAYAAATAASYAKELLLVTPARGVLDLPRIKQCM
jgi:nucleoside phosphorylase